MGESQWGRGYNRAVVKEIEAVYEAGVLRPAEPLPFAEKQRVRVTVSDEPVLRDYNPRTQEFKWLRTNREQYAGKWVALEGDQLVAVGENAKTVLDEARAAGTEHPLLVQVPDPNELPWGGW